MNKRKLQKINQKEIDKEKFIFVIGIPRTGTSLCTSMINQSSKFYLAYEFNNLLIAGGIKQPTERNLFPDGYNGNKICIFRRTKDWYVKYCIDRKKIIMHTDPSRSKEVKIIFTFRPPLSSTVSSFVRNSVKGHITMESCVSTYLHGIKVVKSLMEYFPKHHLFHFENSFDSDEEIRKIFEFIGEEYDESYYTDFVSIDHYAYGSISRENVLTGKRGEHLKYRRDSEEIFNKFGVDPRRVSL